MAKSSTFFPAPSEFSAVLSVRLYGKTEFGDDWRALKAEIADHFDCDADDLHIQDFAWLDGERFADFVTLEGRVIGSLNDHLTPAEWAEFYATRAPDGETLVAQVRAAARQRALVFAN